MESGEFARLHEWIGKSREKLEGLFEKGEIPVVGWLQLADSIKSTGPLKGKLETELQGNAIQRNQVAEQIKILFQSQQALENKNKILQQQRNEMLQISALASESHWIDILCKKETAALAKVKETMKNEYFMEEFDAEDVSTLFSIFNMDHLFANFSKNDTYNLDLAVLAPVKDLQNKMGLEFEEAITFQWKLKLLEKGEEGVARHLKQCSICRPTKVGELLREYGMLAADAKEIEGKLTGWKGYFLVTVNPATMELDLTADKQSKLASLLLKIRRRHKWESVEDCFENSLNQ